MIIDFHCHLGVDSSDEVYERLNYKELKDSMDKWGIDKSVAFPFNGDDQELIEDSLDILEKSKEYNWIIPFLRINPKTISRKKLEQLLEKDFKGLKLHSRGQNFDIDDEKYFWVYENCQERGLPVLFHSAEKEENSHPDKVINVAEKYPSLNVVMAHFFGNHFPLMKIASNYPNLYVDTSMNSGTMKRKQAVEKYGFKNLIFGSDVPYDSQGVALLKVKEAGLNREDEELILHGNAERILNLNDNHSKNETKAGISQAS